MKNKILSLLDHLYDHQSRKLLREGEKIIPNLTSDDVLQPMDFPQLEEDPMFRFEEGVLFGLGEARAAIVALLANEY